MRPKALGVSYATEKDSDLICIQIGTISKRNFDDIFDKQYILLLQLRDYEHYFGFFRA